MLSSESRNGTKASEGSCKLLWTGPRPEPGRLPCDSGCWMAGPVRIGPAPCPWPISIDARPPWCDKSGGPWMS